MSARGTTHARVHRKVIIREGADEGGKIFCAWADCDADGYTLYQLRSNDAKPGMPPQIIRFVFCSERHRQYFLHTQRRGLHGHLPAGWKGTIL